MEKIIVTSIFDIKKRYPDSPRWRNIKMYLHLFKYFDELNVPTILFIETHLLDKIKKRDNLFIIPFELEDLPTYKLLKGKNLDTVQNGDHLNLEFTAVINAKTFLIQEAKKYLINKNLMNNVSHLIWLDAGIAHIGSISREQFINDIQLHCHDKVMNVLMKVITLRDTENLKDFLRISRGHVAAGIFIIPFDIVEWYNEEYYKIFDYSVNECKLMCFEEQIMSVVVAKFPKMFKFSFSDYSVLKNLNICVTDFQTVVSNLIKCREIGNSDLGLVILRLLLKSLANSRTDVTTETFIDILYNGQIISYYEDKILSYKLSFILGYLYHNKNKVKEIMASRYENIKSNINFLGLDFSKKTDFPEDEILNLDDTNIIWRIIF